MNHLLGLGKTFEDEELNIKILNCLTRTWEPKITTIKESKNLATMTMEALFGKLLACKLELAQQSYAKETEKKRKGITLKVKFSREESQDPNIAKITFNKKNSILKITFQHTSIKQ